MSKKQYQTVGRTLLTEYLSATARTRPQRADEIYDGLMLTGHAPGKSSIYRLIAAMCEEGTLRRTREGGEGGFVYQYVGVEHACHNHFHLQCLSCGSVMHLECACSEEIAAHLEKEHGFAVDSGRSVLYGICTECQKKNAGATAGKE